MELTGSNAPAKKYSIWLAIVSVGLIGMYAAMFIPALAGRNDNPQNGIYLCVWTALFFWLLWKRRDRKGVHGLLIGVGVALVAIFVSGFTRAYVRSSSVEGQLAAAADGINRTAPKALNSESRLDGATAGPGRVFTYRITFIAVPSTQFEAGAFDSTVAPNIRQWICGTASLKPLLDRDVVIRVEYRGSDGKMVGTAAINRGSCAAETKAKSGAQT